MSRNLSGLSWHNFIVELSDHLKKDDVLKIKVLCSGVLPAGRAEELNALTLLQYLSNNGIFNENDQSNLCILLQSAGRRDLVTMVNCYIEKQKHPVQSDNREIKKGVESTATHPGKVTDQVDLSRPKATKTTTLKKTVLLPPGHFQSKKTSGWRRPLEQTERGEGDDVQEVFTPVHSSYSATKVPILEVYKMDRKPCGKFIIINNDFDSNQPVISEDEKELLYREGTDVDEKDLYDTFTWLNFEVECIRNATATKLETVLCDRSTENKNYDCFGCAILSHGFDGGVYGNDGGKVTIEKIQDCFEEAECLWGKPKLVFIQACQGNEDGKPVQVYADSPVPTTSTPSRADSPTLHNESISNDSDFIFAFPSTKGKSSYRHPKEGTWFINELCKVLQECASKYSLTQMLTRVNAKLSEKEALINNKVVKQTSDFGRNTLRKEIYFYPDGPFKQSQDDFDTNQINYAVGTLSGYVSR